MKDSLTIQSHRGPYTVRFGKAFAGLESLGEKEHLLIDSKVAGLYEAKLKKALGGRSVLRIDATEGNKSLERIPGYVEALLKNGVKRDHVLVAVGGGIIQDITAFIAATLMRGLAWRFYPTTLLAQADSCIGSKSSINIGAYKNQLGTFTPPVEIHIATEVLDTLSEPDMRSGVGEMIKVHILSSEEDAKRLVGDYPKILTDRALLEKYTGEISDRLNMAMTEFADYTSGFIPITDMGQTKDDMRMTMRFILDAMFEPMMMERNKRQQSIDSLQEYTHVSSAC